MINEKISTQRIDEQKERLKAHINWFPLPALISFALALLFIGHLLVNINPRLGNSAVIINMDAELEKEGSIWISLSEKDGNIFVTTFDRRVFSWPSDTQSLEPLENFKNYLTNTALELSAQAAVSKFISKNQTKVVIAVDQRLRYYHVRPIIHALAEIGIDSYAFETQMIKIAASADKEKQENESTKGEANL